MDENLQNILTYASGGIGGAYALAYASSFVASVVDLLFKKKCVDAKELESLVIEEAEKLGLNGKHINIEFVNDKKNVGRSSIIGFNRITNSNLTRGLQERESLQ